MSEATIDAIAKAIQAHLDDVDTEGEHPLLTDWFVGHATMHSSPEDPGGILYCSGYVSSPGSSPHAHLGIGRIALRYLENDIAFDGNDSFDEGE